MDQIDLGLKRLEYLEETALRSRLAIAYLASRSYPKARAYLLSHGFKEEQVEAMPVIQVALMYAVIEYDRHFDEFAKWYRQPAWVARAGLRKSVDDLKKVRGNHPDISWFALLIIPAMEKVHESQVRIERRLAMVQTIEALRIHMGERRQVACGPVGHQGPAVAARSIHGAAVSVHAERWESTSGGAATRGATGEFVPDFAI